MTNIYIFWKETSDPPSPWTRLTRTNQYLRCNNNIANHWTNTGSTTHNHSNTVSSFSCSTSISNGLMHNYGSGTYGHAPHNHSAPSSWSFSSANNTPPSYGLDIIYMDLTQWETYEKRFPDGSVILSNGVLIDSGYLTRFTSADGYYINNTTPGTISGSSSTHAHTISGTTATNATSSSQGTWTSGISEALSNHSHAISLTSSSTYPEPANIVTRLYEVLTLTAKAVAGTVVFIDGTVSGSIWSILSSWNGYSIKSGNSNPTLSGSDTHTQTFSGNTNSYGVGGVRSDVDGDDGVVLRPHYHTVSGTLTAANHTPYSKYVVPAVLLTTLYHPIASGSPQIVGLTAW